jgi:hypothetical protein
LIWLPMIIVATTMYSLIGMFVWCMERDARDFPDQDRNQAILGLAIWWLPFAIYWVIKKTILLIVCTVLGFYQATYQLIRLEFFTK